MNTFRTNLGRIAWMLILFAFGSSFLSACNLKNPDHSNPQPVLQFRTERSSASSTTGNIVVFEIKNDKESIVRTFPCEFNKESGVPQIDGTTAKFLQNNFKTPEPASLCKNCMKENPNFPNRKEYVYEEGDIQIWNEACKCFQRFHYRDENREVCAYFNNKSPSKYSWMGFDNYQRDLPVEKLDKPAPHCKR